MHHPTPHTSADAILDEIEPLEHTNHYRDAARMLLPLIEAGIAHCLAAETPDVGRLQIKYALGLEQRSMREMAPGVGVSAACISRGAREFVERNNLPLPHCMKSEAASQAYSKARQRQLADQ